MLARPKLADVVLNCLMDRLHKPSAVAAERPAPSNGISGDARPSTAELGKRTFDMKVEYAVRQIRQLLGGTKPQD